MVSGYIGMFGVGLVTVLLLSFVTRCFVNAMLRSDLISCVIWLKVLIWIYAGFVLGNFWLFLGVKVFVIGTLGLLWDSLMSPFRSWRP
jgi:hypothetical protein